jgi:hypothetical protein
MTGKVLLAGVAALSVLTASAHVQPIEDWLLVAAGCDLTPTWAWSWTAGVPVNRCWVYF